MSWIEPWEVIEAVALNDEPLGRVLGRAAPGVRAILERALERRELTVDEGEALLGAEGDDLVALVRSADTIRAADVGDEVTYVVNRNINFTNVCFVNCQFCAFKRQRWEEDAYTHGVDVVLGKVEEAIGRGATEVCMQGGINPEMGAFTYRDMLVAIKSRFPQIHVHAFSPMEIMYGARRTNLDYPAYIGMLRDHGLGSIPGTAAEILDDEVREILSHKKVDVRSWVEIITTAHRLGVPTTATVMYGHVETAGHIARHIDLLRRIQKETGGFTEFVPLGFIWENTKLYRDGKVAPQAKGLRDLRLYAVSRLMLRGVSSVTVSPSSRCAPAATTSAARSWRRASRARRARTRASTPRPRRSRRWCAPWAASRSSAPPSTAGSSEMGRPRPGPPTMRVTVLAGGVGGARFLSGLIRRTDPRRLTVIGNTGDDEEFFGLHVAPDLDTVVYTLAGIAPRRRGWGLAGDGFTCLAALGRIGFPTWFRLGDRDLATHLARTAWLRAGWPLSRVTAELARVHRVRERVLPMTDERVRTFVHTERGRLPFQDYLVRRRARGRISRIEIAGARQARPAPGVLGALGAADAVVIAPSNPLVSIGPILASPCRRWSAAAQCAARSIACCTVSGSRPHPPASPASTVGSSACWCSTTSIGPGRRASRRSGCAPW